MEEARTAPTAQMRMCDATLFIFVSEPIPQEVLCWRKVHRTFSQSIDVAAAFRSSQTKRLVYGQAWVHAWVHDCVGACARVPVRAQPSATLGWDLRNVDKRCSMPLSPIAGDARKAVVRHPRCPRRLIPYHHDWLCVQGDMDKLGGRHGDQLLWQPRQ